MNTQKAINPAQVRERKVHKQNLKSFNAHIVTDTRALSQGSSYQKLINFVSSGDIESAKELIEKAGYTGIFADFILGNAELDMKLEILAAVMPVGAEDA